MAEWRHVLLNRRAQEAKKKLRAEISGHRWAEKVVFHYFQTKEKKIIPTFSMTSFKAAEFWLNPRMGGRGLAFLVVFTKVFTKVFTTTCF